MNPRQHMVAGSLAILGGIMSAGESRGPSSLEPGPDHAPLRVMIAGCSAVTRGPVCEIDASVHTLTLWIEAASDDPLEVFSGTARLTTTEHFVDGGRQLTVELRPGTQEPHPRLAVVRQSAHRPPAVAWQIPLAAKQSHPRLAEAERLRTLGRTDEARAALGDVDGIPPIWRARAQSLLARLELSSGEPEQAIALFREAMIEHRRDGRISDEVRDANALAYTLLKRSRFAEARAALRQVEPVWAAHDEGRIGSRYYHGLLSRNTGAVRTALRDFEEASRGAERLRMAALADDVRQVTAYLLQSLGRTAEAIALADRLGRELESETEPCRRASLASSVAWTLLLVGEQGDKPLRPADAERLLIDALESHRRCPRPVLEANALVNLALASLQQEDLESVARYVEQARRQGAADNPDLSMWLTDIQGRAAMLEDRHAEAVRLYEELAAQAPAAGRPDAAWRAATGLGEALASLGRVERAIDQLEQAEVRLDELTLSVPLSAGRASFLGGRERSARVLVDLLMADGRPDEALAAARRARTRGLASSRRTDRLEHLESIERARWDSAMTRYAQASDAVAELSATAWQRLATELPAHEAAIRERQVEARDALEDGLALLGDGASSPGDPRPRFDGEVLLAFHPSTGGRYWGFVQSDRGVVAELLELPARGAPAADWSTAILGPFERALRGAGAIRILPYGELNEIDIHALPFDDAPLVAHAPVFYSADLPAAERPASSQRRALVVSDPSSDLRFALSEGRTVSERLDEKWGVTRLEQRAARRDTVLSALPDVELLHFAGHAVFAGVAGWDSQLTLTDEVALSMGDILALPSTPRWVVLSGCETAASVGEARGVDLSLAHAFLVGGSSAVVAATREVPDALARDLALAIYRDVSSPGWSLERAASHALVELAREDPRADWAAYRILTP